MGQVTQQHNGKYLVLAVIKSRSGIHQHTLPQSQHRIALPVEPALLFEAGRISGANPPHIGVPVPKGDVPTCYRCLYPDKGVHARSNLHGLLKETRGLRGDIV